MAFDTYYRKLLSEKFPTPAAAAEEIVNLQAILRLPKGTEHFISDVHGEYGAFCHLMNNCSGVIREKVEMLFPELSESERSALATLIYYPAEVVRAERGDDAWFRDKFEKLLEICKLVASKYTRSKVRKAFPPDFGYIIDELMHAHRSRAAREAYCRSIYDSVLSIGRQGEFIAALASLIKRLAVDCLHVLGDVYDRGERPDKIMDYLETHHNVDVQWGNHDILWMGAGLGSRACIAAALALALKFGNFAFLEEGYGISLRSLERFAQKTYGYDARFAPTAKMEEGDRIIAAKMRKAVFVLQMKLEGQLICRHPEFGMDDRVMLQKIDWAGHTADVGEILPFDDEYPTVAPDDPLRLTEEESALSETLRSAFLASDKLRRHVDFLFSHGSLYKVHNGNLLFHGCIPLTERGDYAAFVGADGKKYRGKSFMDYCARRARQAYAAGAGTAEGETHRDYLWYLWCGKLSPLYGRDRMTSFERIYCPPAFHAEAKNPYYRYIQKKSVCEKILADFGAGKGRGRHIVNGHVPVLKKQGESPIKAEGKLIVIDGGFCRAYQPRTGIAGYTLIYNSYGMRLAAHEPFDTVERAIAEHSDIHSEVTVFERARSRIPVSGTDVGRDIEERIRDLKELIVYYERASEEN